MDPFEEFEFKPLTDGLGFHNRNLVDKPQTSTKFDFALEMMAPDTAESLSFPQIQPALPRKKDREDVPAENIPAKRQESKTPISSTVDEILKTLGERRKYDFEEKSEAQSIYRTPSKETFAAAQFEFSAALLDGMLIIASYLAAMIVLLMVTKVDLFGNLLNADEESMIYLSLIGMFATITWIYLTSTRMFLGFTPGEWVFDQRMGYPQQLGTAEYSLKVALRSFVVLATGFIVVPLTSMISRKDWLGKLMGVELIKKV